MLCNMMLQQYKKPEIIFIHPAASPFAHNHRSPAVRRIRGSGVRAYAHRGRLTTQLAGLGNNAVQNMNYLYDSLGNLKTRTDANTNLAENYDYDSLNRVITTTASGAVNISTTYAYDAIGNLTCKSDISACMLAAF